MGTLIMKLTTDFQRTAKDQHNEIFSISIIQTVKSMPYFLF